MKFTPTDELLAIPQSDRDYWISLLETRKQTKGKLKDGCGFCCIGAYADGQEDTDWDLAEAMQNYTLSLYLLKIGNSAIGEIKAATYGAEPIYADFVDLNDQLDFTFPDIIELLKGNVVEK